MKKVAVLMGSDSDWPVVRSACAQLDAFGIPYEAHIPLAPPARPPTWRGPWPPTPPCPSSASP